jgi:enamine deaminase RidA (YjgF/YER057c/UK114 family)
MDLTLAMRTAATVRRFRSDPVPDQALHRALDAARFAPSGGNRQGWHVIVVRDPARRRRLKELYLRTWRPLYEAQLARSQSAPDAMGRRRPGTVEGNVYAEHMDEVPVHLVVTVEQAALLTPFPVLNPPSLTSGSSIYPFVQNLLLALRSDGLGASLTMLLLNEEAEVKALLGIPDGFALAAHVGVGWPARPHPARLRRRPVEDFTSLDHFGRPFRAREQGAPAEDAPSPAPGRTLISSGSSFEAEFGYSRAVVDGDWVHVSGTTGFDYGRMTISDDVVEQAEQCLRNIAWTLEQAGSGLADVVRVRYLLPDPADFPRCRAVLRRAFDAARPAATMMACGLADPRMKIEIEVTARRQRPA